RKKKKAEAALRVYASFCNGDQRMSLLHPTYRECALSRRFSPPFGWHAAQCFRNRQINCLHQWSDRFRARQTTHTALRECHSEPHPLIRNISSHALRRFPAHAE